MTAGFVMMCHTELGRAAQVARFWAKAGAPVVVHVDGKVGQPAFDAFAHGLSDLGNVSFSRRFNCEWGTWSLVAAAQAGAQQMLDRHPQVGHVFLASGACLPLRPLAELTAYLAARPQTDFIESVTAADVDWTAGGLHDERFTLHFPFSWRRQRWLFDRYVRLQRRLNYRRPVPAGLEPHLGSQWWCLTRRTLTAILQDPDRARQERYFRGVWIPDESYFQTLVRRHSRSIESRSLTLSKFDVYGKPHVFYDDHLDLLRQSDCFVARKVWPRANLLYRRFLDQKIPAAAGADPDPVRVDRLFAAATERRTKGRAGLYMQSRFPRRDHENGKTPAPYAVFHGFAEVIEEFEPWATKHLAARVHGHLFAPERVEFAGGAVLQPGCLSDSAALRDYNPQAFLTNLLWNTRGETQAFQFGPRDTQACNWFMATDPNAQIAVITGAWAVPLFRSNRDFADLRREAARLQKIELAHLGILRSMYVKARVRIWTIADFIENPVEPLQSLVEQIGPRRPNRLIETPRMVDLTGFGAFLQRLRNEGMQPRLMGEFPVGDHPHRTDPRQDHIRLTT